MDATLAQILTYLYALEQRCAALEAENATLREHPAEVGESSNGRLASQPHL